MCLLNVDGNTAWFQELGARARDCLDLGYGHSRVNRAILELGVLPPS